MVVLLWGQSEASLSLEGGLIYAEIMTIIMSIWTDKQALGRLGSKMEHSLSIPVQQMINFQSSVCEEPSTL